MREGWNVIIRYDEAFDGVAVYFVRQNADGTRDIVAPILLEVFHRLEVGAMFPEPTLRFSGPDARGFLNDLANGLVEAGFAPDAIKSKDEVLAAVREHLKDMQDLVFGVIDLPGPITARRKDGRTV